METAGHEPVLFYLMRHVLPGLMMALSDILKVVSFCFGGTPAFLKTSIDSSALCWLEQKAQVRMDGRE